MKRYRFLICLLFPLITGCEDGSSVELPSEKNNERDTLIMKAQYYMDQRDFKQALFNTEKAISTFEVKNESNPLYMNYIVFQSEMYTWFQHLDDAERVILKSTGLPTEDVEIIINAVDPFNNKNLVEFVTRVNNYPETKTKIGPHLALSLVYNILGDTLNLQKEQQIMLELSQSSNALIDKLVNDTIDMLKVKRFDVELKKTESWFINASMALYKVREAKENAYGYIIRIKQAMTTEGETRQNQLYLAHYLYETGQVQEASKISDKYLAIDGNDIGFLTIKMNIEMSLGNVTKMKEYEMRIQERKAAPNSRSAASLDRTAVSYATPV